MRTPLIFALLLLILIGCSRSKAPIVTKPTAPQIAEFVTNSSITLPPSAQAIGWYEERLNDAGLWLQVQMPVQDLQTFLDSSPFRGVVLETNDLIRLDDFRVFWTSPPLRYRAGQQSLPNGRFLDMLIDQNDSTNVMVYLMWFET